MGKGGWLACVLELGGEVHTLHGSGGWLGVHELLVRCLLQSYASEDVRGLSNSCILMEMVLVRILCHWRSEAKVDGSIIHWPRRPCLHQPSPARL